MITYQDTETLKRYIDIGMQQAQQQLILQNITYTNNVDTIMKQIYYQAQLQKIKDYNDLMATLQRIICGDYSQSCPMLGTQVRNALEYQARQDFTNYKIEDVPPSEQQPPPEATSTIDLTGSTTSSQN